MGMTIDENIQGIQIIKAQAEWDYPLDWQIVLDKAILIMRKYQKIQEVMDSRPDDDARSNSKTLGEIEVIMYGDND